VGRLLGGLLKVRARQFIEPVWGSGDGVMQRIQLDNPADLLFSSGLQPGDLRILVAYGKQDELNTDAHAESFVWLAAQRNIAVDVSCDPEGTHSLQYFRDSQRVVWEWVGRQFSSIDCQSPIPTAPLVPPYIEFEPAAEPMEREAAREPGLDGEFKGARADFNG
jgi:hypothetical protein